MRNALIGLVFGMAVAAATPAAADLSIGFSSGPVSIGINVPTYPRLVAVPGVPVYYAPSVAGNYFFYDGLYWVFQDGNWFASDWYNGPWRMVAAGRRAALRPARAGALLPSAAGVLPRLGRQRAAALGPALGPRLVRPPRGLGPLGPQERAARRTLPTYQRHYSGNRYPHEEERHVVRENNYHYQPHDNVTRQHYDQQRSDHAT